MMGRAGELIHYGRWVWAQLVALGVSPYSRNDFFLGLLQHLAWLSLSQVPPEGKVRGLLQGWSSGWHLSIWPFLLVSGPRLREPGLCLSGTLSGLADFSAKGRRAHSGASSQTQQPATCARLAFFCDYPAIPGQ